MECPFCNPRPENILHEDGLMRILIDSYPASRGHLLVVPRRHVERWEELSWKEKIALLKGIDLAMEKLAESLRPDGFNVGINLGGAAGQTVPHLHVHVIPRWKGDCNLPGGGVRKAVLDIEDENLSLREKWERNRLKEDETRLLKEAFLKGGI